MAERHADVVARIGNVEQLKAVVTAMRGIAAARAQEARALIAAIDAYGDVVEGAIGRVAALMTEPPATPKAGGGRRIAIAFCAQDGFAGAFSERVLDGLGTGRPDLLVIVGLRGVAVARERGLVPGRTEPMVSHVGAVPALATRLADLVYDTIAAEGAAGLDLVHARYLAEGRLSIVSRRVLPFDFGRVVRPASGLPPLTTLAPAVLIDRLAGEYVFAELCLAAMHAFAAENEARLRAMAAARGNIEDRLAALQATERQLRQQEITAEIIELAAGAEAARR